jgi:formylglycine-generating enzyme required for sulfatase activity
MGNNPSCFKGNLQCPVEQVSWGNAVKFCQKLSQQTGEKVRLPSMTEWEYACRAGTSTSYYFGENHDDLKDYAWYEGNSGRGYGRFCKTHPVGEKSPNGWGLYDMNGNVWELCADYWTSDYEQLPKDGKAFIGNNNNHYRALSGGCYASGYNDCRSLSGIDRIEADSCGSFAGFRVVV